METATPIPQQQFSVKLWPPSLSTRKMIGERMANNLSSPTLFTRKYGSLSKEEAAEKSQQIEDAAFAIADQFYQKEPDGDGSSAIQLYAKECSKLILDVLKKGPSILEEEIQTPKEISLHHESFFDISKGQRAFIDAEEAQQLLSPLKKPGNSYTRICFSNRSFGQRAAEIAAPILSSLKDQLKEVDLSDFVAGRPEAEALEVMNIFSSALEGSVLKFLNISDNALGEKGVRAFEKLLQSQNSLEELYLMNDGISEEAAAAVCELVPSTEKLRVLHFHNNMTGDDGAISISKIVERSPLLEDFRCSSTRVGSEGGIALSKALGTCKHLRKLDLRDNMFGVKSGVALSEAISLGQNLTELYLSYLNLKDKGAVAIADVLKSTSPSLEVLEIAGNDITAKAAPALAACIATKPLLTKLSLSENGLKDDGAIVISNVLEEGHERLMVVDMSVNSLRRAGARRLALSVVQKPEFKLLNLNGNFIPEEAVDELKEIFKKCLHMLGPLDENDPEGEDDDEEEEESGDEGEDDNEKEESRDKDEGIADELESKLKSLDVNEAE